MVPTIAPSGSSFKGAFLYYLHDKDADTKERVAWTHTENLPTDDADKAWKVMAYTAMHQLELKAAAGVRATGRKLEKPVFSFSLAWHPEQKPEKAHMLATAKDAVGVLGLAEHQAVYVSHNDEPQPHVHVLINRVDARTGKAATLSKSKERLSAWALVYEKRHGKVYCQARAYNSRQRAEGRPERHRNPVILAAWRQSDNGRSFQAALKAQGFTLAQGNRRFVVIDRYGKAINPVRHLDVKAAAFADRLRDLDVKTLPTAAAVQKGIKTQARKDYHASRRFDRWSAEIINRSQDRQLEERAALSNRYARAVDRQTKSLATYYKLDDLKQSLAQLRERLDQPSLLRRMTGAAKQDRAEMAAQEKRLANIEQRMTEQMAPLMTEWDLAMSDQADRHAREKEMVRDYLAERRPSFYLDERTVENERPDRGRDLDGGRERELRRAPLSDPGRTSDDVSP